MTKLSPNTGASFSSMAWQVLIMVGRRGQTSMTRHWQEEFPNSEEGGKGGQMQSASIALSRYAICPLDYIKLESHSCNT